MNPLQGTDIPADAIVSIVTAEHLIEMTLSNTTFLMLEEGRLIFDGSIEELLGSDNPFIREFMG